MDELDQEIIRLLQLDGRASNAEIARAVGVSEGTVRRRLRQLIRDELLRVMAVPNLEKRAIAPPCCLGCKPALADQKRQQRPSPA